jgi:uncharacterized membrane protein YphA (DoxX/SURF4 family)
MSIALLLARLLLALVFVIAGLTKLADQALELNGSTSRKIGCGDDRRIGA